MDGWKKVILVIVIGMSAAAPAGCQEPLMEASIETPDTTSQEEVTQEDQVPGMPNPAAVYCEGLGYSLEAVMRGGGEDADCIFPDGTRCGQWDFLAGRCGQEYSYCTLQEGELLDEGVNIASCRFSDGSSCSEYLFYLDECEQGEIPAEEDEPGAEPPQAEESETGIVVVGWMGYIVNTPEGAQFDDYVIILPENQVGEFGIEGKSEDVEAQIVALRDREEPGKYAHFWGTLTCEVIDYGGCQLLVEMLRVDGPGEFFDPEIVHGWEGTIVSLSYDEPGAPQPDDSFILAGEYPVQYGIDSAISAESGERDLAEVILALRDSGTPVRIWGEVLCGVPDAGGCSIQVYKIETDGEVYEIPINN